MYERNFRQSALIIGVVFLKVDEMCLKIHTICLQKKAADTFGQFAYSVYDPCDTYHHQSSSNYQSSLFIHLQSWHYIIITLIQLARMSRDAVVLDGDVTHTGYTFHEP